MNDNHRVRTFRACLIPYSKGSFERASTSSRLCVTCTFEGSPGLCRQHASNMG